MKPTQLKFLGATGTVTGSKYLLTHGDKRILIDCGLFQGYKELRLRNWDKLPIDPKSIDAILLTHAHIDHSGYLPLIVKEGFTGAIIATEATFDLCSVLLPDSGHLQEEDARRANKYQYTKHHPARPLYTIEDARFALEQFDIVKFARSYPLLDDVEATWYRAGHILGASMIMLQFDGKKLLFTGDLGRPNDPVMKPPAIIQQTDYLVTESTYGNRLHEKSDPKDMLKKIINDTAKRGGTVLIPSFAVGRAQSILYEIYLLKLDNQIPDLPVYLDSPMAINATKLFYKHAIDHKLSKAIALEVCKIATYTKTIDQSKAINANPMPKIIISASGMATGGRILHHLKLIAPDVRNTILFTGYQAGGTRGVRILNQESEIKIHGQLVPVRAHVAHASNTSAHADYQEMLQWLGNFQAPPQKIFLTHGEPNASLSLKQRIESTLGWHCYLPDYLEEVDL